MNKRRLGTAQVALAAVLWSFGGVLCKWIPWGSLSLHGLRTVFAALFLMLLRRGWRVKLTKGTCLGALGTMLTSLLYISAAKLTTAANAIVLQFTSPVFIVIFSALFFHKKIRRADLAAVLFTLFGILLVRLTQVAHTDEMDRLLVPWNIPWLRAASGIVAAAFLFGVVVIMAAGSGALLEQMTGLPAWIGNALFMLAVALVALLGVTGMVSAFSALIPVLVLATLAFAAAACIKFGTGNIFRLENVNTNPLMPTWLVASLTFVAYNLLGGIGIMAPIGKLVKKRSVIYWGITLAGVMLTVVAASILFSMAVYPAAIEAELPMVAVATAISPMLGTVYGIVLLLSMFCNALASLVAMLTYMEQKQAVFRKHKKLTLAAAAVLSWIGSLAGFGDLISVIFPVFGYLSVVFLVCMMVHFIQCKRREKQSA